MSGKVPRPKAAQRACGRPSWSDGGGGNASFRCVHVDLSVAGSGASRLRVVAGVPTPPRVRAVPGAQLPRRRRAAVAEEDVRRR